MPPNFVMLDATLPDVGSLVAARSKRVRLSPAAPGRTRRSRPPRNGGPTCSLIRAREDPKRRSSEFAVERTFYRLADELRDTILVACSKCEWKAAFRRDELIAAHGTACPMPSLLERLAAPSCPKVGSQWDRCGVHYVEPIGR
jgi:hypothetical protein